jgi:gluconate kinase
MQSDVIASSLGRTLPTNLSIAVLNCSGLCMAYRVELAARAARDLEILYLEKSVAESQAAVRWYNG